MILGLDPGERRVGVAIADLETRFARPLEVIDLQTTDAIARIGTLVEEHAVALVGVGLPLGLSGDAGPAVAAQSRFIEDLRDRVEVPIEEHDERLTTVLAERALKEAGVSRSSRKGLRDAIAAQIILQSYLDSNP